MLEKRKRNPILESQYKMQGSCCYYCKKQIEYEYITRDHIKPISKGNTLVQNKIFACRKCNILKGDSTLEEFKEKLLDRMKSILNRVVENGWKINNTSLKKFRNYVVIMNTLSEMIDNEGMPKIIFT